METKPSKLPTLAELSQDVTEAYKNDSLNLLLNQAPPAHWIKEHPTAKGVKYIPIDKVEFLLTRIFQLWRVEVISYQQLFQSVAVHVRLHYRNPVTLEWHFQDGLGAMPVQTDRGASAADLAAIKSNAVMLALPSAESYAVKDAAEKIGAIFGKDINRGGAIEFGSASMAYDVVGSAERKLAKCTTIQQVNQLFESDFISFISMPEVVEAFEQRKNQIKANAETKK